ncbi:MAG: hypothetical protein WCO19_04635 [Candidatus Saccharibacteria bacterium]
MDDVKPPTQKSPQPTQPMGDFGGQSPVARPVSISITDSSASPRNEPSNVSPMTTETPSVGPMTPQVVPEEKSEAVPELIPGLDTKPNMSSSMSPDASTPNPEEVASNTQMLLEQAAREEKVSTDSATAAMAPMIPAKKSRAPAIIVAIILALALAGGAFYAYLLNNKKADNAVKPAVTTQATTATTPVDLAKTSASITDALKKVDDTKDFQETDLTDTTLGL